MESMIIEVLKKGNIDVINTLNSKVKDDLIIDIRKNSDIDIIINNCLNSLNKDTYLFALNIIYDMEKYKEYTLSILKEYNCYEIINSDFRKVGNILYKTSFGRNYLVENIDDILKYKLNLYVVFSYLFSMYDENKDIISIIANYPDVNIRGFFIKYIVNYHKDRLEDIYPDIDESFMINDKLIDVNDISKVARNLLLQNDIELYKSVKDYILKNYKYNDLAENLIVSNKEEEFIKDADLLFLTSRNYKFEIYKSYSKCISDKILSDFEKKISKFKGNSEESLYAYDHHLKNIFLNGLGNKLLEYVDKYLSLSNDTSCCFVGRGTTASCYRIGDYAFKLNQTKWSYEDIICPNLYLILNNLEEDYIRDDKKVVIAGLEVQKYLRKSANNVSEEMLIWFKKELARLGYYTTDTLINGSYGDNCRLLDNYMDADYINPKMLPDEFKKTPLVLVDRDRVYKLENKRPKQR